MSITVKSYSLLGVNVSSINMASAWQTISAWIESQKKAYICVAPVSTIVDCQRDESYKAIVNAADMVTPDGMPVFWYGKMSGQKGLERVSGADFMGHIFEQSEKKGYRHYFYGGMQDTLVQLETYLMNKYPKLNIAGFYSPPFRESGEMEEETVIQDINKQQPDFIWVGLGSPKQDVWMANHRPLLDASVIVGVGAAFDFLAGVKPRAPKWMRSVGLEWFFRLCCEPRRLWRRYLIGNSLFIYFLIKRMFQK